jgi:hypothetical protein
MRGLGRFLQLGALVLLPLCILLQLSAAIDIRQMLLMLVMGVAAFLLGRLLEGYGRA